MNKIGYILSPGRIIGGAEIYIIELAKWLYNNSSNKPKIYFSHNRELGNYLENEGIPNQWLGSSIKESACCLYALILNDEINIVHSNGYHTNFIVQRLIKNQPNIREFVRFYCTEHGWINTNLYERLKTKYDLKSLRLFDNIFVVAPYMKAFLERKHKLKGVNYIPSFVGTKFQKYLEESIPLTKRPKLIIGVGRLSIEKQFQKFILIAKKLITLDEEFRFIIIGNGSEKCNIERIISELQLSRFISLMGFLDNPQPYYEQAEYLLITSSTEGSPLVALEAMTTETIVIASKVGFLDTLLSEERGYLFEPNESPQIIANLIRKVDTFSHVKKRKIVSRAKEYVKSYHTIDKTAHLYEKKYNTISK